MSALEKVAKNISRNHGINVVFKGKTAYTDGKKIVLPVLPDDKDLKDVLNGYCDHECGHIIHTDVDKFVDAVRRGPAGIKKVINILEDLRIERLMIAEYGGCKANLKETMNYIAKDIGEGFKNPLMWLWVEGRRDYGLQIDAPDFSEKIFEKFGYDILDKIRALKSVDDAIVLAHEILEPEPETPEDDPQDPEDSEDDSEDGGDSEGGDSKDPEGDSEEGDSEEGDSEEGEGDSEDGGGDPEDGGSEGDPKDGNRNPDDFPDNEGDLEPLTQDELDGFDDPMKKLKDHLEGMHDDALKKGEYMPCNTECDRIEKVRPARHLNDFNTLKGMLGKTNVIKKRVTNLFNSKNASRWVGDREQGKINNRALAQVKTGNRRVFKEKYVSVAKNTCASFLIDCSASMSGQPFIDAMKSAILFVDAFESVGIKTEVLGYTTGSRYDYNYGDRKIYGRVESLVTYVFKEFDEHYGKKVKARLGGIKNVGLANNCDGENVKIAYDRIKVRPEKRKVLFVLTDGMVANAGSNAIGRKYLRKVIEGIEKEGIVELIGIGLYSPLAKDYYKKCIEVLDNSGNLAKKLLDGIKDILK